MNAGATAPDWGSVDLTVLPTITVAKGGTNLESFTAGDILYATGATTLAKLAKGSAAEVLAMNAGATAPEWVAAAGGSALLQNKFYYFTDAASNGSTGSWFDSLHPIGDGTIVMTPTTTGNIIQIHWSYFMGHSETYGQGATRWVSSSDAGSSYTTNTTLGGTHGCGGHQNYQSNHGTANTWNGFVYLVTANTNEHLFKHQYYGDAGSSTYRVNGSATYSSSGGGGVSRVNIQEWDVGSSSVTDGGNL
jgi:hypothetical protein